MVLSMLKGFFMHLCPHLGLANFARLDAGYFGQGIYVTPNGNYAAEYASGRYTTDPAKLPKPHPQHSTWFPVILCSMSVGLAYPVTRAKDYTGAAGPSVLRGKPIAAPFDARVATVHPRSQFECCEGAVSQYMEICVSDKSAVLPLAVLRVE